MVEISRKEYDQIVAGCRAIIEMQGTPDCPFEYSIPSFENFADYYWNDGPNGNHYEEKKDFYLPAMILYMLKDEDGNYLYEPYVRGKDDDGKYEAELSKTRKIVEEMFNKHFKIV